MNRRLPIGVLSALLGALAFVGVTYEPLLPHDATGWHVWQGKPHVHVAGTKYGLTHEIPFSWGRPAQAISAVSWMNGGGFFPIPGLGDLSSGLYNDFRKGSLVSERGPAFSLTRATATTGQDHEGLIRTLLSGEARFHKLRRVENLGLGENPNVNWTISSATVTSNIADPIGGTSAYRITATGPNGAVSNNFIAPPSSKTITYSTWIRRVSGTGQIQIGRSTLSPPLSAWQRMSVTAAGDGGNPYWVLIESSGDAVDVWHPQVEDVTGQAITAPSEYVSNGVLSSPWHGAGVDGVKYFATANGNTVASNVVTEATGAPLTVTAAGLAPYGAHTNIALQSENFGTTWAALAATSPTRTAANHTTTGVTLDLLGDDSAVLAEGYTQGITFTGDAVKSVSLFFKCGTATDSLIRLRDATAGANRLHAVITCTGGVPASVEATGTEEAGSPDVLAGGVYRFRYATTSVTAANTNNLEVYPAASNSTDVTDTGDANFGGVMVQNATSVFPYIKTTTAAVTVNADVVTADGSTVINQTEGTLYVMAVGPANAVGTKTLLQIDDGTDNERVVLSVSGSTPSFYVVDGGALLAEPTQGTRTAGASEKYAGRYKLNDSNLAFNGTAGTADTTCTMPTTTTIRLGQVTSAEPNTTIQVIALSRTGASDANLALATTP